MPNDPLSMSELEPSKIQESIEAKKIAKKAPPTEMDMKKEERLSMKEKRLSDKSQPPPPQTDVPIPEIDKGPLLDQLSAYRERFPKLKKRTNVNARSSVEDILDEIHFCEMQLGSSNTGSFGATLFKGSMVAVEAIHRDVWNPFNLNLNGLANVAMDNLSEFEPLIDELMIKYGGNLYVPPEIRLILSVGALMVTVHGANSGDARIATALQKMNETVKVPSSSKDL